MDAQAPPLINWPSSLGQSCNIVTWILTGLSIIAVALRLVARHIKRDYGIDDAVIVLSLIFLIAYNAMISISISHGVGAHAKTLTKTQGLEAGKWVMIANVFAVHCFTWPKLAVVLLLKKLLLPSRFTQIVLFSSIVLLICCMVVLDYMLIGSCSPVAYQWDKSIKGSCWNPSILTNFAIFSGSLSAALDMGYALYPVYKIWNLQMSAQRRVGYCCIMSLGLVAFGFTVAKCTKLPALDAPADPTYLGAQLLLWTDIESNVVTLAACIPTLSPLAVLLKERTSKSFGKYSSSKSPSDNPFKHNTISRRSKHIRLGEDELSTLDNQKDVDKDVSLETMLHARGPSLGRFGGDGAHNNKKHDLESGPPSSENIELLHHPMDVHRAAWAGKPASMRGNSTASQDDRDDRSWEGGGIVRNVEVSVTESRMATPDKRR